MKQVLISSAERLPENNMFEQGNLLVTEYHVTF